MLSWSKLGSSRSTSVNPAISYCASLGEGGYNDWRLPEAGEITYLGTGGRDHFGFSTTEYRTISSVTSLVGIEVWTSSTYTSPPDQWGHVDTSQQIGNINTGAARSWTSSNPNASLGFQTICVRGTNTCSGNRPIAVGNACVACTSDNLGSCSTGQQCTNNTCTTTVTQCNNGIDDDSDGSIDLIDFGCSNNSTDNSESTPVTECENGSDNDGDTLIDLNDAGCTNRQDNTENTAICAVGKIPCNGTCVTGNCCTGSPLLNCSTGQQCTNNTCTNIVTQCNNGTDDDGDGVTDLNDPGCSNNLDTTENTANCSKIACNGSCVTGNCCTVSQCGVAESCTNNNCTAQSGIRTTTISIANTTATRGTEFFYRLNAFNATNISQNLTITFPKPHSSWAINTLDAGGKCSVQGDKVICTNFTLAANSGRNFNFYFTPQASSPCGTFTGRPTIQAIDIPPVNGQIFTTTINCP